MKCHFMLLYSMCFMLHLNYVKLEEYKDCKGADCSTQIMLKICSKTDADLNSNKPNSEPPCIYKENIIGEAKKFRQGTVLKCTCINSDFNLIEYNCVLPSKLFSNEILRSSFDKTNKLLNAALKYLQKKKSKRITLEQTLLFRNILANSTQITLNKKFPRSILVLTKGKNKGSNKLTTQKSPIIINLNSRKYINDRARFQTALESLPSSTPKARCSLNCSVDWNYLMNTNFTTPWYLKSNVHSTTIKAILNRLIQSSPNTTGRSLSTPTNISNASHKLKSMFPNIISANFIKSTSTNNLNSNLITSVSPLSIPNTPIKSGIPWYQYEWENISSYTSILQLLGNGKLYPNLNLQFQNSSDLQSDNRAGTNWLDVELASSYYLNELPVQYRSSRSMLMKKLKKVKHFKNAKPTKSLSDKKLNLCIKSLFETKSATSTISSIRTTDSFASLRNSMTTDLLQLFPTSTQWPRSSILDTKLSCFSNISQSTNKLEICKILNFDKTINSSKSTISNLQDNISTNLGSLNILPTSTNNTPHEYLNDLLNIDLFNANKTNQSNNHFHIYGESIETESSFIDKTFSPMYLETLRHPTESFTNLKSLENSMPDFITYNPENQKRPKRADKDVNLLRTNSYALKWLIDRGEFRKKLKFRNLHKLSRPPRFLQTAKTFFEYSNKTSSKVNLIKTKFKKSVSNLYEPFSYSAKNIESLDSIFNSDLATLRYNISNNNNDFWKITTPDYFKKISLTLPTISSPRVHYHLNNSINWETPINMLKNETLWYDNVDLTTSILDMSLQKFISSTTKRVANTNLPRFNFINPYADFIGNTLSDVTSLKPEDISILKKPPETTSKLDSKHHITFPKHLNTLNISPITPTVLYSDMETTFDGHKGLRRILSNISHTYAVSNESHFSLPTVSIENQENKSRTNNFTVSNIVNRPYNNSSTEEIKNHSSYFPSILSKNQSIYFNSSTSKNYSIKNFLIINNPIFTNYPSTTDLLNKLHSPKTLSLTGHINNEKNKLFSNFPNITCEMYTSKSLLQNSIIKLDSKKTISTGTSRTNQYSEVSCTLKKLLITKNYTDEGNKSDELNFSIKSRNVTPQVASSNSAIQDPINMFVISLHRRKRDLNSSLNSTNKFLFEKLFKVEQNYPPNIETLSCSFSNCSNLTITNNNATNNKSNLSRASRSEFLEEEKLDYSDEFVKMLGTLPKNNETTTHDYLNDSINWESLVSLNQSTPWYIQGELEIETTTSIFQQIPLKNDVMSNSIYKHPISLPKNKKLKKELSFLNSRSLQSSLFLNNNNSSVSSTSLSQVQSTLSNSKHTLETTSLPSTKKSENKNFNNQSMPRSVSQNNFMPPKNSKKSEKEIFDLPYLPISESVLNNRIKEIFKVSTNKPSLKTDILSSKLNSSKSTSSDSIESKRVRLSKSHKKKNKHLKKSKPKLKLSPKSYPRKKVLTTASTNFSNVLHISIPETWLQNTTISTYTVFSTSIPLKTNNVTFDNSLNATFDISVNATFDNSVNATYNRKNNTLRTGRVLNSANSTLLSHSLSIESTDFMFKNFSGVSFNSTKKNVSLNSEGKISYSSSSILFNCVYRNESFNSKKSQCNISNASPVSTYSYVSSTSLPVMSKNDTSNNVSTTHNASNNIFNLPLNWPMDYLKNTDEKYIFKRAISYPNSKNQYSFKDKEVDRTTHTMLPSKSVHFRSQFPLENTPKIFLRKNIHNYLKLNSILDIKRLFQTLSAKGNISSAKQITKKRFPEMHFKRFKKDLKSKKSNQYFRLISPKYTTWPNYYSLTDSTTSRILPYAPSTIFSWLDASTVKTEPNPFLGNQANSSATTHGVSSQFLTTTHQVLSHASATTHSVLLNSSLTTHSVKLNYTTGPSIIFNKLPIKISKPEFPKVRKILEPTINTPLKPFKSNFHNRFSRPQQSKRFFNKELKGFSLTLPLRSTIFPLSGNYSKLLASVNTANPIILNTSPSWLNILSEIVDRTVPASLPSITVSPIYTGAVTTNRPPYKTFIISKPTIIPKFITNRSTTHKPDLHVSNSSFSVKFPSSTTKRYKDVINKKILKITTTMLIPTSTQKTKYSDKLTKNSKFDNSELSTRDISFKSHERTFQNSVDSFTTPFILIKTNSSYKKSALLYSSTTPTSRVYNQNSFHIKDNILPSSTEFIKTFNIFDTTSPETKFDETQFEPTEKTESSKVVDITSTSRFVNPSKATERNSIFDWSTFESLSNVPNVWWTTEPTFTSTETEKYFSSPNWHSLKSNYNFYSRTESFPINNRHVINRWPTVKYKSKPMKKPKQHSLWITTTTDKTPKNFKQEHNLPTFANPSPETTEYETPPFVSLIDDSVTFPSLNSRNIYSTSRQLSWIPPTNKVALSFFRRRVSNEELSNEFKIDQGDIFDWEPTKQPKFEDSSSYVSERTTKEPSIQKPISTTTKSKDDDIFRNIDWLPLHTVRRGTTTTTQQPILTQMPPIYNFPFTFESYTHFPEMQTKEMEEKITPTTKTTVTLDTTPEPLKTKITPYDIMNMQYSKIPNYSLESFLIPTKNTFPLNKQPSRFFQRFSTPSLPDDDSEIYLTSTKSPFIPQPNIETIDYPYWFTKSDNNAKVTEKTITMTTSTSTSTTTTSTTSSKITNRLDRKTKHERTIESLPDWLTARYSGASMEKSKRRKTKSSSKVKSVWQKSPQKWVQTDMNGSSKPLWVQVSDDREPTPLFYKVHRRYKRRNDKKPKPLLRPTVSLKHKVMLFTLLL